MATRQESRKGFTGRLRTLRSPHRPGAGSRRRLLPPAAPWSARRASARRCRQWPRRQGSASAPALSSIAYPTLAAQNYFDVSFDLDVNDKVEVFGGVNNVIGNMPPVTTQGPNSNTWAATYDVLGSEFFLGATFKF